MDKINKKIRLPGLRNIKTALAIVICLIIYQFLSSDRIVLAVLAVLICMQDTVEKSYKEAKDRVMGNIFGALMAIGIGYLGLKESKYYLWAILCGISVIIIIYVLNTFKKQGSIVLACAVFFIIAVDETPIISSITRVIDTYIGITVALVVNLFIYKPKTSKLKYKILSRRLDTDIKSIKKADYKKSVLKGGKSLELYTYPRHSIFENRDFEFRISSRNVHCDKFVQEDFEGYYRHLMIIEGEAKVTHENYYSIKLKKFKDDFYKGSWITKTKGTYRDFILTTRSREAGDISVIKNNVEYRLINKNGNDKIYNVGYFYCLADEIKVMVYKNDKILYEKNKKNKGALVINNLKEYMDDDLKIKFSCKDSGRCEIGVRADVVTGG